MAISAEHHFSEAKLRPSRAEIVCFRKSTLSYVSSLLLFNHRSASTNGRSERVSWGIFIPSFKDGSKMFNHPFHRAYIPNQTITGNYQTVFNPQPN